MEENERENMENPDKTQENTASSALDVVSQKATGETPDQENEAARKEQVDERKDQADKTRKSVKKNKKYQGYFPHIVIIVILVLAVIAAGVLYDAGKKGIHWVDLKPYAAAYDGYIIRQDDTVTSGQKDWVVLRRWGKAEARLAGVRSKGRWHYDNGNVTLKLDGQTYQGILEDKILTLTMGQEEHIFLHEDMQTLELETEPTETTAPVETTEPAPPELIYSGWAKEYYGWWLRKSPTESWHSGKEFAFWDVCGTLTPTAGNQAVLELWDSQSAPEDRMCTAEVIFTPGDTEAGKMTLTLGTIQGEDMHVWFVEPQDSTIPGMLTIEGSTDTFDFMIFLRPWGMSWEDVNDYPNQPFTSMMPAHYTDWYLSQKDGPMPDYFVGLVFPEIDRG